MAQEVHEGRQHDAALLALAQKLKDVATSAGRPDVVAKAEEAMALIGRSGDSAGGDGNARDKATSGNALIRVLDGLGF